MAHSGHRDNPVEVTAPGDLDRAVRRTWEPSPEQAAAGNYQKAHVIVGGLHITIETPQGRTRSGTAPDGTPWSVQMPAHYGYLKRTDGADGDQVDCYLGPEAHRAHECAVWVIDQVDADSREFDEHKTLVGFNDSRSAAQTYLDGFSDGRGHERAGASVQMSWDEFRKWLDSPKATKKPLAYARSVKFTASACGCASTHNPCDCNSTKSNAFGGSMTIQQTDVASPKAPGMLNRWLSKAWGASTPAERAEMLKEAGLQASAELGKAVDLLHEGDDHEQIGEVKDIFDGDRTDKLETVRAHGPKSHTPPGKVNVGPVQDAFGGGAQKMEGEYSEHAPQAGVERATEMLGRMLATQGHMAKSLRAIGAVVKAQDTRMGVMELALSTTAAPAVDMKALDKAVAAAVAKAMAGTIPAILKAVGGKVAKAEDDKDDDKESGKEDEAEDDDEDDEAKEAESGSGTDIEIVNENEDEDDDEDDDDAAKAVRKAAARERLIAKSLVRLARDAVRKAQDAMADGLMNAGVRQHKLASARLAKARAHYAVAKSLRDGKTGPSSLAIEKTLGTVAKALKENKAKNQDKWPNMKEMKQGSGKAVAEATAAASPDQAQLAKAAQDMASALEKANSGYALLTADVQKLMSIVGNQSRDDGASLPPVAALFKGQAMSKEGMLNLGVQEGRISAHDRDKGLDALGALGMGLPQNIVDATISACAPAVQDILRAAA